MNWAARVHMAVGLLAATFAAATVSVASADVAPYGLNDAGGFRNVLPPGEAGVDNVLQLGSYELTHQTPPHFDDQLPLYENLLYASPALTDAQIPTYFKDATFGVKPDDVASVQSPQPDVTIVRDKQWGVPHIYGTTRAGTMFGTGYAAAADRLFLMDVLRHAARAQLSSFVGGSAGNREMDRTQWSIAPYSEADLQSQIDNAPVIYGAQGEQVVADVHAFVAGINAYVTSALTNPTLLPAEYAAIAKLPSLWTPTDVIAEASLIGGIFGKGGGEEVRSALALQAFERRFGGASGRSAWSDFRSKNDPESPTTVAAAFPYETTSPFARSGLALPDPGSVTFTPVGPPIAQSASAARAQSAAAHPLTLASIPHDGSIGSGLLRAALSQSDSNWELVAARHSADGHPLAVMGPQVGYYRPQILMEEDVHGPGIDARGAAFPGVNLYVELGHGRDYAWSATTSNTDNVDTFAEVLCQDDFHYLYKSQCLPMERLDRINAWVPNADDMTSPGSETLTAYRTVHGIVYARGTVGGQTVAFVSARTTYFHEADSALGFVELNDPSFITSPQRFQEAAAKINFGFNWAYADASHIAYFQSGYLPQRAAGTSPDFPILGTGQYDWKGFDTTLRTIEQLPPAAHPQAIDPDYMVSWNNKPAPEFSAADDRYAYSSVYRSQLIEDHIQQDVAGGKRITAAQVVSAMDEAASEDLRIVKLWPILRQILGTPRDPALIHAIALLDQWYAAGGHRRDLTRSGVDANNAAIELMDAWWPKLLNAEFRPTLGADTFSALENFIPFGSATTGTAPNAPDFEVGWYGFVSKDLRDLIAVNSRGGPPRCRTVTRYVKRGRKRVRVCSRRRASVASVAASDRRHRGSARRRHARRRLLPPIPAGAYSRVYCGGGSLTACRSLLQQSLLAATTVSPKAMYGFGYCAANPQPSCFDQNSSTIASAISIAPFPFQNRPTFQQVVQVTQQLPR